MTTILETAGLGKKYGRRRAPRDCTLTIPAGQVLGLVDAPIHDPARTLRPASPGPTRLGAVS